MKSLMVLEQRERIVRFKIAKMVFFLFKSGSKGTVEINTLKSHLQRTTEKMLE